MNQYSYWKQQSIDKPFSPDFEWNKPEQRSQRGKLSIIGGNKLGFSGIAESFSVAMKSGAGEVKILLPDSLRSIIPKTMPDVNFTSSTTIGSFSKDSYRDMLAIGDWSNLTLLPGDSGRNSETALVYSDFIQKYTGPLVITRDAIDLIKNDTDIIINRQNTTLVASFAQMQKIFQTVYYPKVLTFSMQLIHLVEALHAFTITYPAAIVTFHRETLVIAHNGEVVTTKWNNPVQIWKGSLASKIAVYQMWTPSNILSATASAILEK